MKFYKRWKNFARAYSSRDLVVENKGNWFCTQEGICDEVFKWSPSFLGTVLQIARRTDHAFFVSQDEKEVNTRCLTIILRAYYALIILFTTKYVNLS